jgi:hypothetical protein
MIPFIIFRASSSVTAGQALRKAPLQERSAPPPKFGHRTSRSPPEMVLQMPLWLRLICPHRKAGAVKRMCPCGSTMKGQTEVKFDNRKKAGKLDAQYHQPCGATTFKSILNEYGRGGEVLGLVVSDSGEASSDVYRVADLVAARLPRSTSTTSGRRYQSQRRCKPSASAAPRVTPLHVDSRGLDWIASGTT